MQPRELVVRAASVGGVGRVFSRVAGEQGHRVREAGRGLGFGLDEAWRLVTLHGGTIEVGETPGGGATFVLSLPLPAEPLSAGTR